MSPREVAELYAKLCRRETEMDPQVERDILRVLLQAIAQGQEADPQSLAQLALGMQKEGTPPPW